MPGEAFENLKKFITEDMRMSHIYQPVMLRVLLDNGGRASRHAIASAFAAEDRAQVEYYEEIVRNMPGTCAIKYRCTTSVQRRITRWQHEHVLDAVQRRLDENPQAMRQRRETVEHPFGTIKARMGATHFLMKGLPRVATEMALHVLAYNLTRVLNILGIAPLINAMRA
jgi:hypothetical protein